eukprot:TRINITY_DN3447_c1_g1_i3.p2 TRINITY_DN3447_c1_g1~~TRINITY_DN3447_c1_g1_i3.p2  ORF type:complete len:104 (-),score=0.96 TRINITY_DN3447_c1_g1_i3:93-404(-)
MELCHKVCSRWILSSRVSFDKECMLQDRFLIISGNKGLVVILCNANYQFKDYSHAMCILNYFRNLNQIWLYQKFCYDQAPLEFVQNGAVLKEYRCKLPLSRNF